MGPPIGVRTGPRPRSPPRDPLIAASLLPSVCLSESSQISARIAAGKGTTEDGDGMQVFVVTGAARIAEGVETIERAKERVQNNFPFFSGTSLREVGLAIGLASRSEAPLWGSCFGHTPTDLPNNPPTTDPGSRSFTMRLTLRTLLAYLDDILEPSHAREIGKKISESGYASSLVEHIREVMRKRRLGAPEPSGPGIGLDPNSVAEYLDNTLSPEEVADIEKICLESDLHLAEVAACHQILTIVLGEPVDVPERTRERMYVLGEERQNRPAPKDDRRNGEPRQPVPSVTGSTQPRPEPEKPRAYEGVPDYLRPTPVWRRVGPIVAGLVIGGVWLTMIWSSPSLIRPKSNTGSETDGQLADASASDADDPAATIADGILNGTQTGVPENSEPEISSNETPPNNLAATRENSPSIRDLDGFDPPPPADAPETAVVPETEPGSTTNSSETNNAVAGTRSAAPESATPAAPKPGTVGTTTTPAATATTIPRTSEPTTVAAVTPPGTRPSPANAASETVPSTPQLDEAAAAEKPQYQAAPEIMYASRDGVFLIRTTDGWRTMPRRSMVRTGDTLAAPEPFSTTLDVTSLGMTIEVFAGTALEIVGSSDEARLVLRLTQGRLAFQNRSITDPENPTIVSVLIGDEVFHLTFSSENSVCGVEVVPTEPQKFEQPPVADQFVGNLFVGRGAVNASVGTPGGRLLAAPAWLPLTVSVREQMEKAGEDVPILPVPEWLDLDADRMSPAQRRYAVRFEKELDPEVPIHLSIPAAVESQVPDIATLAVRCLAVTGLSEQLVEALARVEFTEARDAAIQAIRQWLPRDPKNAAALRQALEKNFPPDEVDPVYRLLWGYDEMDARNEATSRILIDWLQSDSEVIRQLAYFHIYRLTGQRHDYRPNLPEDQRRVAMKRWESHLEKNDGKLLP